MQESAARQIAEGVNVQLQANAAETDSGTPGAVPYRTQSEAISAGTSPKSRLVALILCFLVGFLGIHRFYIGRWATGILYFCTAGLFAIGWLLDTILLLFGALTDKHNRRIRRWLPADPHPSGDRVK
ncbi:MAG: TM2 domain-containing protein [Alphaproteobacteria bacterium]|nr:TM2 domain-containing protein [Alphaproteobacteria bacterium]